MKIKLLIAVITAAVALLNFYEVPKSENSYSNSSIKNSVISKEITGNINIGSNNITIITRD